MKKKLSFLLFLLHCNYVIESKLVLGDPNAAPNTTFSFTVGFVRYEDKSENSFARFWTATNDATIASMPDDTKKYGLSIINQVPSFINPALNIRATPMTNSGDALIFQTQNSSVVSITEPNPIYGAAFSLFDLTMQKPLFVLQNQLNNLYSVHNIEHYEDDPAKNITDLLRYDFGTGQEIKALKGFFNGIYTAYSQGAFGSTPSNIALLERSQAVNSTSSDSSNNNIGSPFLKLLASGPIGLDTAALTGGQGKPNLASLGPTIGFDIVASRIYLFTQATAAAGGTAFGIAQIVVAPTADNTFSLLFGLIVPENLITNQNTVVSSANGNSIRITAVKYMQTSTNLAYMIVARDSGTGPATIYAVPMMTNGQYAGMIADFNSVTTRFGSLKPVFIERYFTNVISDPSQIDITNASIKNQITVGGSSTLPIAGGDINQIYVVGDSVYAVIGQEYDANNAPGTYRSQAIFAPQGYIVGWTPWTRVLGSDLQMSYSFVDSKHLTGTYLASASPSSTPQYKSIYQTTFNITSNISNFLTASQGGIGGIQGLFNFNQQTQGFNNALSMMIGTAFGKIALGQTGFLDTGIFKPMPEPSVISFANDKINNHHALIAAEIAHDSNNNHYIFTGGATGVSILTNDNTGISWSGNLNSVNDLNNPQTNWKKIGNFSFVKKLLWDQNYIYILTTDNLYRIALDPNKFTAHPTVSLNIETVITKANVGENSYFLDAIIDSGYILLGTTLGFYQFNNGILSKIIIPGGLSAVSQITPISSDYNPSHSFKNLSNIYILNNTFGTQQAKIYRFVVQNGNVSLFPDTLVAKPANLTQGIPSAFITFDNFISSYFTDGSWNTAQSYFLGIEQSERVITPAVFQVQSHVRSGQSSSQIIMPSLTKQAHLPFLLFSNNLMNMIRESTLGTLIIAGDFQAHTNA